MVYKSFEELEVRNWDVVWLSRCFRAQIVVDSNARMCYVVTRMEVLYESNSYHTNTR
jgi:hypothetical protein